MASDFSPNFKFLVITDTLNIHAFKLKQSGNYKFRMKKKVLNKNI